MIKGVLAVAAGLLVTAALSGWGQEQTLPAGVGDAAAAHAVKVLTSGDDVSPVDLPADFARVMGYSPTLVAPGGRSGKALTATRADGGCSSPFGGTHYGFTDACRQHDLGYDLLRYAERKGAPLGPWARRAVDGRFSAGTHERCGGDLVSDGACSALAGGYAAAVEVNSWRQGWGVPTVESAGDLAPGALGGVGTALTLVLVPRRHLKAARCASPEDLSRLSDDNPSGRRNLIPALAAAVAMALVAQPALLPHPWWVDVVIGAAAALNAYAIAAVLVALRPARRARRAGGGALAVAAIPFVGVLVARPGQLGVAAATDMPEPSLAVALASVAGATALMALVVLLARGVRRGARAAVRHPRRTLVTVVAPALVLTMSSLGAPALAADGGPGTTVRAGSLGAHGAAFLDAPSTTAETPVRVYVGKAAAATPAGRAALAVAELEREGGLDRKAVLLMLPTGSGWVNSAASTALEGLYDGDVATVAVQYASSPSWVAYLKGGEGAEVTARELTEALRDRLDRVPAPRRPRLLVYGESLGAWGGLRAFPGEGITTRADGALWVGVPGGTPAAAARSATLIHADDPVPAWTPDLMIDPSDQWPRPWLPMVSFWQATADVISAQTTPEGHGHRYGAELRDAWQALLAEDQEGPS